MILKNEASKSSISLHNKTYLRIGSLVMLICFFVFLYWRYGSFKVSSKSSVTISGKAIVISDAEKISGSYFIKDAFKAEGAKSQSSDFAFEGKYSLKLFAPKFKYGFGTEISEVKKGDNIKVSVWVYSPKANEGFLVVKSSKDGEYYQQSSVLKKQNGIWGLLELDLIIPKKISDDKLKIYCYTNSDNPVYFDLLSFEKKDAVDLAINVDEINIHVKDGDYGRLTMKRNVALDKGILITEKDSWVDAAIYPKDDKAEKIKVKMRLKGDWLDHLQGDKWSFRVSTETAKSWNRLKVFSLQTPGTRSYMKEWVLHELYKYEDVLTTRYDFIKFKFNNKNLGLYVYEEHFTKQIPEYNLKREGPIVKFSETSLWESRLQAKRLNLNDFDVDKKVSPDILPFGEKKTEKSANLTNQFQIAQNLLYEYQYKLKKPSEIFDIDLIAKYYAIADITGGHHGIIWHNQRFYYNPVIGKLEPIGFDGFDDTGESWVFPPFLGMQESLINTKRLEKQGFLFQDYKFLEKYYFYLNKFSTEDYLYVFIDSIRAEFNKRYKTVTDNFPEYFFSFDYLYERAKKIRFSMLPTSESLHSRKVSDNRIALCNKHNTAIEIIGTSSSENGSVNQLDSNVLVLRSPSETLPDYSTQLVVPPKAKFVVFRIPGLKEIYYAPLSPWSVPVAFSPVQDLEPKLFDNHPAYFVDNELKKVVFKQKVSLSDPVIIPEGYKVIFEAGTKMDIKNKAFIVSYSPVYFRGTEEEPIEIVSGDKSAMGFTVLKANARSEMNFVTFSNFNTLSYKGWNLTGAVTFYESDVDIFNSTFTKNHCEDALNIVRSDFKFHESIVSYTYGDGFDADFCTGIVDKGYFYKTGNDGIDFSTSVITIQNTKIKDVGDKGISIGEHGTSIVKNTDIDGAVIGLASKDLSKVTIKSVTLKNCKQGFAAYQKKPEYGGGFIDVDTYKADKVDKLYNILPGSYLKLVDKEIVGDNI